MSSFRELGVSERILKAIEELGFEQPMPVQEAVIPYLLEEGSGDVVALAQTGTGKTAAYGIPVIQQTDVDSKDAQFLILSPTRELCVQIASDLADFSHYIEGLHVIPMYGGSSIENQIRNFKRGAHVIVATPGRLIDLMERGVVSLDTIRTVILDEADEMLNMGFSEDLEKILSSVPVERKMLMFSATMSKEIQAISQKYLNNAREIVIGTRNEGAENVEHVYYMVHAKDKYLALKRIVDYYPSIYAIIFCRTRLETQEIADKLMQDGYNADSLHGDLSQAQRDLTMNKFRKHQLQLLVATDVAARGLDVDNLTHVINFGLPDDIENYTHRSGRTGRAGKKGVSISIVNLREKGKIRFIEKAIGKTFVQGTMPTGTQICEKQLYKVMDDLERIQVNEEQIADFLPEILRRLDWMDKNDIIKRIVTREFGRFVRYYQDAPELEEVTRKDADEEKRKKKDRRRAQKGYTRFFINIGKKDHVQPVHIIEMLNRNVAGRVDVGRIDLMQNFSFFECPEEYTEEILTGMDGVNYKGREVHVEVAETKSSAEGEESAPKEEPTVRRDKLARERKPERKKEEKPHREEKPRREEKAVKEKKSHRDEKPYTKDKTKSKGKIERHSAQRAPQVQIAQDENFWRDFEDDGDWRTFFRSGNGKPKNKEKASGRKRVNGRKASRTVTKPKRRR
ncbi:MAG: DEAD/DEAH box helicase [Bacteroidaceae bacterium]|nr:DEAD/DEAH box helicase [Bacteroidaceae bacterium]